MLKSLDGKMEVDAFELTVKGKQLCNSNQIGFGIKCFETALLKGINDSELVMAVHNELGNAYFSIKDYDKALSNYLKNLNLSKSNGDILVESMSNGNISSVLKMLGKFEEAITYCDHHLNSSRRLNNKAETVKALYNMGNIYYDNAKACGAITRHDVGQFPPQVEDLLEKAGGSYKEALKINSKVNDRIIHSRILGNYANVNYLLNNYKKSIKLNTEKLKIAQDIADKESERRTFVNRGNTYVIIKNYESAIQDYKFALDIARSLKDVPNELKMLYTIGNTYYISKQFSNAVEYILEYRSIVKTNNNKSGEVRADLCLSIIYSEIGDYNMAQIYSKEYCELSKECCDEAESVCAQQSLQRIENMVQFSDYRSLGLKFKSKSELIMLPMKGHDCVDPHTVNLPDFINERQLLMRNESDSTAHKSISIATPKASDGSSDEFFALLSKYQMQQLKQQNSKFSQENLEEQFDDYISSSKKIFLDTLADSQSRRLDDQRSDMAYFLKKT